MQFQVQVPLNSSNAAYRIAELSKTAAPMGLFLLVEVSVPKKTMGILVPPAS